MVKVFLLDSRGISERFREKERLALCLEGLCDANRVERKASQVEEMMYSICRSPQEEDRCFERSFSTRQGAIIGVDFMIKTVEINGEKVKLQIWDTAGQERFRSITQSYYRCANALILTYDITCEESFRCLPEWLREIEQYASNKVISVLVGNKIDLAERREVSQQRAEEFSKAQDMYYLETSGKESDNVEKLFLDLACQFISEARQNTLVNNVSSPLPGEGKSISYLTCNFN
ncbi:Ras-related protein Rab-30 [Heterocephalus glaber]|uniref:Ras-related protein Rab-30 n=1 Tax=Heterocephalus glaber TaxID=10181 RepID=G5BH43_HETGA|nr:Ras-related protein Rab-30 [Heterocephalus glaber]